LELNLYSKILFFVADGFYEDGYACGCGDEAENADEVTHGEPEAA
jgi:hypothetical protein